MYVFVNALMKWHNVSAEISNLLDKTEEAARDG
jgi:hypothetical protein